jgi:hypothetical protein
MFKTTPKAPSDTSTVKAPPNVKAEDLQLSSNPDTSDSESSPFSKEGPSKVSIKINVSRPGKKRETKR